MKKIHMFVVSRLRARHISCLRWSSKHRRLLLAFWPAFIFGALTERLNPMIPWYSQALEKAGFENPTLVNELSAIAAGLMVVVFGTASMLFVMWWGDYLSPSTPQGTMSVMTWIHGLSLLSAFYGSVWLLSTAASWLPLTVHYNMAKSDIQTHTGWLVYSQVGREIAYVDFWGDLQTVTLDGVPKEVTVDVDPHMPLAYPHRDTFIGGGDLTHPTLETWVARS